MECFLCSLRAKMLKVIVFFGVFIVPSVTGQQSGIVKQSDVEHHNHRIVYSDDKPVLNDNATVPLELTEHVRNFSESQLLVNEKKKQRRAQVRKRKDKGGKYSLQKNRPRRPSDDVSREILRNNEKANLVRSKTIEILKGGLKILSADENYTQTGNKSFFRLNETLLEKILSSAASKQNVLLSAAGAYKLPVGVELYETKTEKTADISAGPALESSLEKQQTKRQNKKQNKNSNNDYDYEYDLIADFHNFTSNDSRKIYETVNADKTVGYLLEKIAGALKNLKSNESCPRENKTFFEDPCQKWLDCRENLDRAFTGDSYSLPSCPCTYPSSIFYDEMIWDTKQKKYFRWRDASSESERLDIYKPGAAYCIRSLLTRGSSSVASQQCCYDKSLQLLTRGSGAGTMNFISPDVSRKLHYTVDILPWRLCKGDFTRYNTARRPNNGNNCQENPNEELYQLQVKLSKIF